MKPQDKQDFEELLANCADEPIRFPGAIQPHGVLLTLTDPALGDHSGQRQRRQPVRPCAAKR